MKSVKESTVAMDVAVSNPPLGKLKTRKHKMKWSDIVKEESEPKVPTGKFSGGLVLGKWTYYGMGGQMVTFSVFRDEKFPKELSGDELLNLKNKVNSWSYYPLGRQI